MAGSAQTPDFAETQKIAANMIASTMCNSGAEALLNAQSDMLRNLQSPLTDWMHRRREAIDDAYRLMERMRDSRELNEIVKAQQDWAAGAMQRFAADMAAYPSLFANSGQRVTQEAAEATSVVGEMARRAAEIARPGHKPPKVPAEPKPSEDVAAH